MPGADSPYRIADCRGGQNSADPATAVALPQVVAADNVEWYRATVARKRRGSRLVERDSGSALPTNRVFLTLAGGPYNSTANYQVLIQPVTDGFYSWGTSSIPPLTDWKSAALGPGSTFAGGAAVIRFNGKWFFAADTADDRMYMGFRGSSAFSAGGFVGLAAPSVNPTVTASAGAVTDTREYRYCRIRTNTGGHGQTRSEPSPVTSIALVAQRATATAPGVTATNDLYESWELQVASDDDNYATWWIVGQALATVDIVDNNASILGLEPAPELGLFEPPRSHKYLGKDDNRLLMAGLYEDTTDETLQQRVWFTPVLGDRDEGDDERVPDLVNRSNWVDLDGGDDGGPITAFGPATLGDVLVFKLTQLWRLVRTGNVDAPYIPRPLDTSVGTFGYRTVCAGQDALGNPAIYFASARGPMRVGRQGVEYLGGPIEDQWARVNQHGDMHVSQHAVYYVDRGQYWLWVSLDGATTPTVLLVYSVRTGGWARYTGVLASALCSAMLPRYISEDNKGITTANVLTAPLVPYCCPNINGQLVECDAINPQTGVALDTDFETYSGSGSVWTDGTPFAASLTTGNLPKTLDGKLTVSGTAIAADAATGVSVSVTLIPDYDTSKQRTGTTTLTAGGSETIVLKTIDDGQLADCRALQAKIGDASAVASQWAIHDVQLRVKSGADR